MSIHIQKTMERKLFLLMENSIILLLKNKYDSLSEGEKKIANYIFEHSEEIPEISIAQFAKEASVAASGIVRLCKHFGLSGFSELKRNLLKCSILEKEVFLLPDLKSTDDTSQVFNKVFSSSIKTLEDTIEMLDMEQMKQAIELFYNANSIHFFGVGTSSTIAQDAYYRLMRIGFPAYFETDSHIMQIAVSNLTDRDLAVGISHCGSTIDTVQTLKIAKERGASTIAITSKKDSSICQYADITIVAYSDEIRYPIEAVSARIAHITILDAICVALSLKNPEQTKMCMNVMHDLFANKRFKE